MQEAQVRAQEQAQSMAKLSRRPEEVLRDLENEAEVLKNLHQKISQQLHMLQVRTPSYYLAWRGCNPAATRSLTLHVLCTGRGDRAEEAGRALPLHALLSKMDDLARSQGERTSRSPSLILILTVTATRAQSSART